MAKLADLVGTNLMPLQRPTPTKPSLSNPQRKFAELDLTKRASPEARPVVLQDTHYALGSRYPITDLVQVKTAAAYFEQHVRDFSPAERHTFAGNLCKRASDLGVPEWPGEAARVYGGQLSRDINQAKLAFSTRAPYVVNDPQHQDILEKVAAKVQYLLPEDRVRALEAFDKVAGLENLYDTHLQDPYRAMTEKWAAEAPFSERVGAFVVREHDLRLLVSSGLKQLREVFTDSVVEKLMANPVSGFKGLPDVHKQIIARMAVAQSGSGDGIGPVG